MLTAAANLWRDSDLVMEQGKSWVRWVFQIRCTWHRQSLSIVSEISLIAPMLMR